MDQVSHTRRRLFWNAATCVCLAAGFAVLGMGQSASPSLEYQVKAAYLLNFTKFVDWPAGAFAAPDSPVSICILGNDPFGRVLDEIVQGEAVNARRVTVQRMSQRPVPQACQVVFIGNMEKDVARIVGSLGAGILTVGEGSEFLRGAGMIAFVIDNRRVRFDINQSAAMTAGLRLSSRLLSVARAVEK